MRGRRRSYARVLASAFLAGAWSRKGLATRGAELLGKGGSWLDELATDVLEAFPRPPRDARDALAAFLYRHRSFHWAPALAWQRQLRHVLIDTPRMADPRWEVRRLDTLRDVADWLGLTDAQLDWFADRRGYGRRAAREALMHYHSRWVEKPTGGARLLEAPKPRLRALQRKVLNDVLSPLPPHGAAHGFRKGRSVLTHAGLHTGKAVVVRFDLEAFFAHVHTGRAYGVFRAAGYPEEVARTLIALCTHRTPLAVLAAAPGPANADEAAARHRLRQRLAHFHLPQGAPTSPALANLCAFGLDVRLAKLAEKLGATYSRYADDLVLSGPRSLGGDVKRLERIVGDVVRDEGFHLNRRKTRVMRRHVRQEVTGVVVNAHLNVGRAEVDRLKALLHNCLRRGPASQSRGDAAFRDRVQGQVGWVEQVHPARGARLRALFNAIDWSR